jgi:hypothetical protein
MGSASNNLVNTSNKYDVLSIDFATIFEEINVNDKASSSSKIQVEVDTDTNKVGDPFVDVEMDSDNEEYEDYNGTANYVNS